MFCPICGQQQINDEVRFCSRCGFLLTGIAEVVANKGLISATSPQSEEMTQDSPRKRGVKQGAMILLVGMLLIVPLLAMLHMATNTEPFLVAVAAIISFWGGILRMVYAWMFESKFPKGQTLEQKVAAKVFGSKQNQQALPPPQSIPASDYVAPKAGSWHTTNDLVAPGSVTDSTTKLLEKEEPK